MTGSARLALAAVLALAPGLALADAPRKAPAKTQAQTQAESSPTQVAQADQALSPRWIPGKWEIRDLTVWVYTPGHFEGRP